MTGTATTPAGPVGAGWWPTLLIVALVLLYLVGRLLRNGRWWTIIGLKYKVVGWLLTVAATGGASIWLWVSPWWVKWLGILCASLVLTWLVARRSRSSSLVSRWSSRATRAQGVASPGRILRHASSWAMKRKATTVRPSLAHLPRVERATTRTREVAVELVRSGLLKVWASIEDVVLVFGPPRVGKSIWLAARIIDAPGAALVTSTKPDLYRSTLPGREAKGPVLVFNPVGIGGLPSSITFDPLTGCADPTTAADRAADMLGATTTSAGSGDREFWEQQARRVLGILMHAAALGSRSMHDVLRWVGDPDGAQAELAILLRSSPQPAYALDAAQFVATTERTRSSITSSIMPALGWLNSPTAVAASTGTATPLDVAALLATRGTVHLLGSEESQVAPLMCALTGHIAREARRLADAAPGGRLDPPLTLGLDEAASICPVPLPRWTADMGGRGITIIAAFQSRAQVEDRWGPKGRGILITNAGATLVFGASDEDDMRAWSARAGTREVKRRSEDKHGKPTGASTQTVDVLPGSTLANLPVGHVVLFRRGLDPIIGRVKLRRDVRRAGRPSSRPSPAPAHERVPVREAVGDRG